MADQFNALQAGTLSPEDYAAQQQINRQQRFADMLMQQNQQPQGQMISGRYVAPSFFQMLNPVANMLAGAYVGKEGDTKAAQLAQKLRTQEMTDLENYQILNTGRSAQPSQELAGPAYQGVTSKIDYPAIQPNPQAANLMAANSTSAGLRALGMKKLTEGPNWAEVSQINPKTGNTETYVYDKNSADPRSTMRFVSVSKPALTASEMLHLNDQGIGTGGYGGPSSAIAPVGGTMPTVGGNPVVNTSVGTRPAVGGNMPALSGTTVKPVSATNVPENTLINTYGYDPFKPPPMPAMPSGSAARAYKADLYKPLDGTAANTVTGATTYVDALGKYNEYVNGLNAKDLANPQVRTKLNSLYSTVKLTGKEANNLGVLNGGDEKILEAVVPNYSDILVTKKTVQKILDEQKEFGSSKIVATYRTAQKPVPENMRKYVVVPKVEEAPTGSPKQTGATARAVLNGRQIEVRGGKWVDSSTGQEVK